MSELLPVTVEDRRAAVALMVDQKPLWSEHTDDILAGNNDSNAIVAAFARHRTEVLASRDRTIGELVGALERIAGAKVAFDAHPVGVIETMRQWASDALAANPLPPSGEK